MRAFAGQITGFAPYGTPGMVWKIAPFYLRVFWSLTMRKNGFFPVIDA